MAKKRSFRWTSTHESADLGEVSVLAIVETLIAMWISLEVSWYHETILHIVVGASVAPLLLLRTEESTELGLDLTEKCLAALDTIWPYWLRSFAFFSIFPIVIILIRVLATVRSMIRRPLNSILAIANNWKRIVLCLDIISSPEAVPGLANSRKIRPNLEDFRPIFIIYELLPDVAKDKELLDFDSIYSAIYSVIIIIIFPFMFSVFLFASFIALFYRFSLKSTSLLWSPLLWIISSAQTLGHPKFRLAEISRAALYRVMCLYSVVVLIAFVWKLFIWLGPQMVVLDTWLRPLLEPFIEPSRMPLWQFASATNALLALGLYFLADLHLTRMQQEGNPYLSSESTIKWQIGTISVVRNTLALYTIACTIYIAWKVAAQIEWPPLEFMLFPWG